MNTVTVAEIGRTPGAILSRREPSIITNNGRAQNVIINVAGMDIDEVVDLTRSLQAKAALRALRRDSHDRRLASISPEEIDAEIESARSAR